MRLDFRGLRKSRCWYCGVCDSLILGIEDCIALNKLRVTFGLDPENWVKALNGHLVRFRRSLTVLNEETLTAARNCSCFKNNSIV